MEEELQYNQILLYHQAEIQDQLAEEYDRNQATYKVLCAQQKKIEEYLIEKQAMGPDGAEGDVRFKVANQANKNDELAEDVEELKE